MSTGNKAVVRKFYTMLELGDPSLVDGIIAADYINHDYPSQEKGAIDAMRQFVTDFRAALSNIKFDFDFQVAEGDKVVSRYTVSGIHQGPFFGIPATGKRVSWTVTATMGVVDNKIQELWMNWDQLGLLQQLGVVPAPSE